MRNYFSTVLILGLALNVQAQVTTKAAPLTSAPARTASEPASSSAVVAFKANATYISGEPVASNTPRKIDFNGNALFDEGKDFSMSTDEFIAPSAGYYHFDFRIGWDKFTAPATVTIRILTNWYATVPAATWLPASTNALFDANFSTLLSLKAGDKVSVEVNQNSGAQQTFKQAQFMGYKVN